jgi:hypothetical protein
MRSIVTTASKHFVAEALRSDIDLTKPQPPELLIVSRALELSLLSRLESRIQFHSLPVCD